MVSFVPQMQKTEADCLNRRIAQCSDLNTIRTQREEQTKLWPLTKLNSEVVSVKETKTLAMRCLSSSMLSYKMLENTIWTCHSPPAAQTGHNDSPEDRKWERVFEDWEPLIREQQWGRSLGLWRAPRGIRGTREWANWAGKGGPCSWKGGWGCLVMDDKLALFGGLDLIRSNDRL